MKHRNYNLAWVQHNDPKRLRIRVVKSKKNKNRSAKKKAWKKDIENNY